MQTILSNSTQGEPDSKKQADRMTHTFSFFKAIDFLFAGSILLLPIFFLPGTVNLFNLNKAYLIVYVALLSLVFFFAGSLKRGVLMIRDFKAYTALLVLFIAAIVGTVFSIDRYLSLYGVFGNYGVSLMVITSFVIIGFVASNVRVNIGRLMMSFYIGVTLSTLVSLLSIYVKYIPVIGAVPASFTTTEGTNLLLALQVVLIVCAFYDYLRSSSGMMVKASLIAMMLISFVYVTATMYIPAMVLVFAGLFVVAYLEFDLVVKQKVKVGGVVFAMLLIAIVNLLPMTRTAFGLDTYTNSPRLGVIESWLVSSSTLRLNPISGRGLGTFQYEFSRYRPQSLNGGDQWLFRFQSPFNDVFMWLEMAGLVGLIAFLYFVYYVAKTAYTTQKNASGAKGLMVSVFMILAALMVLGSTNILYFILMILFGVLLQAKVTTIHTVTAKPLSMILLLLSLGLFGYVGYKSFYVYAAQISYASSLKSNQTIGQVVKNRRAAVNFEKQDDFYRREWVVLNLRLASAISRQENLTQEQIQAARSSISEALTQANLLTRKSGYNVANWQLLGVVYSSVINAAQEGQQRQQVLTQALRAYATALVLEPTNPRLNLDVGGIYFRAKDYQSAANQYSLAVQKKPDYANARYNLAYALKELGAYEQSVQQMEVVLRLIPEDNANYAKVQTELDALKKLREEQAAKQQDNKIESIPSTPENLERKRTFTDDIQNAAQTELDVAPKKDLNIEVPVGEQVSAEGDATQNTVPAEGEELPAADGANVDQTQGETEAPFAKPAP